MSRYFLFSKKQRHAGSWSFLSLPLLDTVAINEQLLNLTHTLLINSHTSRCHISILSTIYQYLGLPWYICNATNSRHGARNITNWIHDLMAITVKDNFQNTSEEWLRNAVACFYLLFFYWLVVKRYFLVQESYLVIRIILGILNQFALKIGPESGVG